MKIIFYDFAKMDRSRANLRFKCFCCYHMVNINYNRWSKKYLWELFINTENLFPDVDRFLGMFFLSWYLRQIQLWNVVICWVFGKSSGNTEPTAPNWGLCLMAISMNNFSVVIQTADINRYHMSLDRSSLLLPVVLTQVFLWPYD